MSFSAPETTLTTAPQVFDGPNGVITFPTWRRIIQLQIVSAHAGEALTPWPTILSLELPPAEGRKEIARRSRCENTARAILCNGLSDSQQRMLRIDSATSPLIIWESLIKTHGVSTKATIQLLIERFNNTKPTADKSATEYISRLRDLEQQLAAVNVPTDPAIFYSKVISDLYELPLYSVPLCVFTMRPDNEQTLDTLETALTLHETKTRKLLPSNSDNTSETALAAFKHTPTPTPSTVSNQNCQYCNLQGHTLSSCSKFSADFSKTDKKFTKNKHTTYKPYQKPKPKTYCNFHKSNSHNTTDCQALKRHQDESDSDSTAMVAHAFPAIRIFAGTATNSPENSTVILDSGCTTHMCPQHIYFTNYTKLTEPINVSWGNASTNQAIGRGSIYFTATSKGETVTSYFNDVLHVPALGLQTLISLSQLDTPEYKISHPTPGTIYITSNTNFKAPTLVSNKTNGLYIMNIQLIKSLLPGKFGQNIHHHHTNLSSYTASSYTDTKLWHYRLGHPSHNAVRESLAALNLPTLPMPFCVICPMARQTRPQFVLRPTRSQQLLEMVHSDICGPFILSKSNMKYFITFTDDYSRYSTVHFMSTKGQAYEAFIIFHQHVTTLHNLPIKSLHSDNGPEYKSLQFTSFCQLHGILQRFTTTDSAPSNGVAERLNRTLLNKARGFLFAANASKIFWAEAVASSNYVKNMLSTRTTSGSFIPWQLWHNTPPPLGHLRIWGSQVYVKTVKKGLSKLSPRSTEGILVGYPTHTHAYRIYLPFSDKIIISRDVVFNEESILSQHYLPPVPQNPKAPTYNTDIDLHTFSDSDDDTDPDDDVPIRLLPFQNLRQRKQIPQIQTFTSTTAPQHLVQNVTYKHTMDDYNSEHPYKLSAVAGQLKPHKPFQQGYHNLVHKPFTHEGSLMTSNPSFSGGISKSFTHEGSLMTSKPSFSGGISKPFTHEGSLMASKPSFSGGISKPFTHEGSLMASKPSFSGGISKPFHEGSLRATKPSFSGGTLTPSSPGKGISFSGFTNPSFSGLLQSKESPRSGLLPTPQSTLPFSSLVSRIPKQKGTPISTATTHIITPKTIDQAMESPQIREWQDAIFAELKSLESHGTWHLTDLPVNTKPIPCMWVFTIKTDGNNVPVQYKARLVVKGFHQQFGVNYTFVDAPVATLDTIRCLIAFTASNNHHLQHYDISGAFLNGELTEDIYMSQPPGFSDPDHPNKVCHLQKALYGLKQGAITWYKTFTKFLTGLGFIPSYADPCLFVIDPNGPNSMSLVIYVDDILASSPNLSTLESFYSRMSTTFKSTNLGFPKLFLGIKISKTHQAITMDQAHYITLLYNDTFLSPDTTSNTDHPLNRGDVLNGPTPPNDKQISPDIYRHIIGSLLWISRCTRPDIAFAISWLGRHSHNPTLHHHRLALTTLRYLHNTCNLGLTYTINVPSLTGYTDSDYAEDQSTRKSTTGYVFFLATSNSPISWKSKLQSLVTRSVTEAEYVACSEGSQEATWLSYIFNHLGLHTTPVPIYVDNSSARSILDSNLVKQRTKHISIRYHYCRDRIQSQDITILPISGINNRADIFTKVLDRAPFKSATTNINILPIC
jgi:transposase InsO family protein